MIEMLLRWLNTLGDVTCVHTNDKSICITKRTPELTTEDTDYNEATTYIITVKEKK